MKQLFFVFIFCLTFFQVKGQKPNNIWYFGQYAGLYFSTGVPVALNHSKLSTDEGCTTISDNNGMLLFYTNGVTVWNRNHSPMQNGTGLMGHESASQSVIAVPKPGSTKIYYIFTVDHFSNNLQNGLRYSIIDLDQDNGLGAITSVKNVLLETPVTEKLTAALHGNGFDYWILVHKWNSDGFSAYLLTENGVSTTPVISFAGEEHKGILNNSQGCMKVSPSGLKLALASNSNIFELFDFNNITGVVSNGRSSTPTYMLTYDVEFSPDETKLYCSGHNNEIYQFDLTHPNVFSTGIQIGTYQLAAARAALQLGPDNKIYKARAFSDYVGVINNPNQPGLSCNYVNDGVYLGDFYAPSGAKHLSLNGLPSIPAGGFGVNSIVHAGSCAGRPTVFSTPNYKPVYQVTWDFGDPDSGPLNYASGSNPSHTFSRPGSYTITLTLNYNGFSRQIIQGIKIAARPDASLGPDTVICAGDWLILQKTYMPGTEYLWQDGNTSNYYVVNKSGTYKLQVKQNDCIITDSIKVTFTDCPSFSVPNIITSNHDGFNESFDLSGLRENNIYLRIFNRWGNCVYEKRNYKNDWQAENNSAGIYYYIIQAEGSGRTYKGWFEVVK